MSFPSSLVHVFDDKVGSQSSVYTPGSMSPATNVSGSFGSGAQQQPSQPPYAAGPSSASYPSPYPSPQAQNHPQSRLTPVLSTLSIEGQQLRYPPSPLSPQGSSIGYSSPQSRHRRTPSSAHSTSHDQSPQHLPSPQQSQRQHPYEPTPNSSSKQMMPGTPTHPGIPRPAIVAAPVPVPNLIKKSRGRQVPSVTAATSSTPSHTSAVEPSPISPAPQQMGQAGQMGYFYTNGTSSLAGWGGHEQQSRAHPNDGLNLSYPLGAPPGTTFPGAGAVMNASAASMQEAELRSRPFVCTVEGCGKAYIRAEHLKRHVRSIHTNDKREFRLWLCIAFNLTERPLASSAYECPHPGCGREFSRYDNLCQHFKGVHGPTSTLRNQPGQ